MHIRHATLDDLPRMMAIYALARDFMVANNNPKQWAARSWPPEDLVKQDIETGKSYVCEQDGVIHGVFFYDYGEDIDPTYREIENGSWRSDEPYGVVHRIAADPSVKGVGTYCLNWAFDQSGHMRIDTHDNNSIMKNLLAKLGFEKRGIIYVKEDNDPRIAYEKTNF